MRNVFAVIGLLFLFACSEDNAVSPGDPVSDSASVVTPPNWSIGTLEGRWRATFPQEYPQFASVPVLKNGNHGIMNGPYAEWKQVEIRRNGSEIWYETVDPWMRGYNDDMLRVRLTVFADRLEGYGCYNPGYGFGPLVHLIYFRF